MNLARSTLAVFAAALVLVAPASAFQFPLSDTSSRAAYFLGKRHDATMGEFLARYSRQLPAPKSGPYVSDITFFTPFAQLVEYSNRQGTYNAQQAEIDGANKFLSVEITVYLYFTATYGELIPDPPPTRSSTTGVHFRAASFWHEFSFHVFDGDSPLAPATVRAEPQYRCIDDGCSLIGSEVHLTFPAESFSSDSATVEVATPEGQLVTAEFDLDSLR